MLDQEGIAQPGEQYWDAVAGQLKRHSCDKKTYVEYCRRQLFDREQQPLVRRCRRLRGNGTYCIVSIFKAARSGVRIVAYDQKGCQEFQLVLIPTKLLDLDIAAPPTGDGEEEWADWSQQIIPRLVLGNDGFLKVGNPPLLANGLPARFSLTGSAGEGRGKGGGGQPPVPSRLHVTMFFDHL